LEEQSRTSISAHVDAVIGKNVNATQNWVEGELDHRKLPLAGGRTTGEIANRLAEKAADRSAHPLEPEAVRAIEAYLAIEGDAVAVVRDLEAVAKGAAYVKALGQFSQRIDAMKARGLDPADFSFAATFGPNLEYSSGLVFQIEADGPQGALPVAGGGRYDDLLSDIGSPVPVSAVGCAIGTENLLLVAGAQK